MTRPLSENARVRALLLVVCGNVASAAAPPTAPSAEAIAALVLQLGADRFAAREAASARLRLVGRVALPALRRAVVHPDPEVRRRCKRLVAWIDSVRIAPRANRADLIAKGAVFRTVGNDPEGAVLNAHLKGKQFGDEDLDRLAGMDRLTDLDLRGSSVTDAGLAKLVRLGAITHLYLSETRITGSGFVHLKRLPKLAFLELNWAPIQDKSLAHLATMPPLQSLSIGNTPISAKGLARLRGCKLWYLGIWGTRIGDEGLAHVRTMKELHQLDLARTTFTIRGLKHLEGHDNLRQILRPDGISEAEWKAFERKLPKYGNWDW